MAANKKNKLIATATIIKNTDWVVDNCNTSIVNSIQQIRRATVKYLASTDEVLVQYHLALGQNQSQSS
jgi:hypothetical protein